MMSLFAILLVTVLNLIPADVTTFTMKMGDRDKDLIRFTKQADGGWSGVKLTHDIGTFYVTGTKLTMKGEGKDYTQDLAKTLGVDDKTDWNTIQEIKMGATPVSIERKASGLDFVCTEKSQGQEIKRVYEVRWPAKESK